MKIIQFLEVKSDIGAGIPGASLGVDAIKKIASNYGSDFFKQYQSKEIKNDIFLNEEKEDSIYARKIQDILEINEVVAKEVKNILEEGNLPIVLSGDHSTSMGTIAGIKMAYKDAKIAVIWIDAHSDLHSPYTTPSGNMHGMPVLASLGEDNISMKVNELDITTKEYWERCKKIGNISPKIHYEDLVYVGLRDYEGAENNLLQQNNVCVISVDEVRSKGINDAIAKIVKTIQLSDYTYISFDVDSLDPSVSCGTGISVPHGLQEKEVTDLILGLLDTGKVCCFEITEINPSRDTEKPMEEVACTILQKIVRHLQNKSFLEKEDITSYCYRQTKKVF